MARRFIVDEKDINVINENNIEIMGSEVKHIQVLRHDVGDEITINSKIYKISQMKRECIVLEYVQDAPIKGVPQNNVTAYLAMLKNDKMDFLVQKAVEIGVKTVVPFFSSNVIVKLDDKGKQKRKEKLQKIADEACKQCGRMDNVVIEEFLDFNELLCNVEKLQKVLFAYEAANDSLRIEIEDIKNNKYNNIGIIIGAEGGFTPKEAERLQEKDNVKVVSLGSRILRAETAALNLLSILIYEMEE